ncbi:hypothetical protein BHM03_00061169 [Ensete ventricosum]|uniref:Uncharacterized protein n=1 Tax=Ensete ventricosum TaxID=4639 RepID=A0A426XWT9_ENSVE|nr:hypothetical protein B296_00056092 [Ensete ventricosum]RZS27655.1 hypothetical protein BHM03_00061169 [Ensete ventricosum]
MDRGVVSEGNFVGARDTLQECCIYLRFSLKLELLNGRFTFSYVCILECVFIGITSFLTID